jgi:hypothetical protein
VKRLIVPIIGALLALAVPFPTGAQSPPGTQAGAATAQTQPAATSGVSVSVNCYSNPERVTIRNNRNRAITITSVGSIYQPRSNEPFYVYKRLGSGRSITYTFGSGSGPNRLTGAYIFNNDVGSSEGARIRTPLGRITDRC